MARLNVSEWGCIPSALSFELKADDIVALRVTPPKFSGDVAADATVAVSGILRVTKEKDKWVVGAYKDG